MLQLRFLLCFLLAAMVAVSAITVKPIRENGLQKSLLNVDGHGHENAGERIVRQFYARRRDSHPGYNYNGGGYKGRGYGGKRYRGRGGH